jgi:hypothetical protein
MKNSHVTQTKNFCAIILTSKIWRHQERKDNTKWELTTKQLVQFILKIRFRRNKLSENAGYVNNMKKILTT